MTLKEREDRFIETCKESMPVTFESEILLRFGYSSGARELDEVAYARGMEVQRARVLGALGAMAMNPSEGEP